MQDVAAAGQVAAVGQGRPAQVHAAFGAATRWSLAIRGETGHGLPTASLSPDGRQEQGGLCALF